MTPEQPQEGGPSTGLRTGGLMRLAGNGKVWKKPPKKGIILSGMKWSRRTEGEGCWSRMFEVRKDLIKEKL
jgi:hypothetical protein